LLLAEHKEGLSMTDKINPQNDNKDAESGEPVQLDKDQPRPENQPGQQQGQQGQPARPQQQPDQQKGDMQHEGGQKR
jgi:hypothetical protein